MNAGADGKAVVGGAPAPLGERSPERPAENRSWASRLPHLQISRAAPASEFSAGQQALHAHHGLSALGLALAAVLIALAAMLLVGLQALLSLAQAMADVAGGRY